MQHYNLVNALILGGTTTALCFARSLGRKGVEVTVASRSRSGYAMRSKWGHPLLLPDPLRHPEECYQAIVKWGRIRTAKPVLIPTLEEYLPLMAEHRQALGDLFQFTIPSDDLIYRIVDKETQYPLFRELGLSVPRTVCSSDPGFPASATEMIGFPSLLKPSQSHIWRQVRGRFKARMVTTREELEQLWEQIHPLGIRFLLQEIIPGGDDQLHSYLACYSAEGVPVAEITTQKLRQKPEAFGIGCRVKSTPNHHLVELSRKVLEKIKYSGQIDMEFKWDGRDNSWKLIEANPRATSFSQLAVAAGVDLPWIGYLEATGGEQINCLPAEKDVLFMHISWDLQTALTTKGSRLKALRSWFRNLLQTEAFAVFDFFDPKPIIFELLDYLKNLPGLIRPGGRK